MPDDLPTYLWVDAKIRELSDSSKPVYVLNKGNKTGGLVLAKVSNLDGDCKVYTQQRDLEGQLGWFEQDMAEGEADQYIRQELEFDTDLWVLEIEDREMKNPFID